MNIVFRVDASLQIGIGHVMRCLTLADALKTIGARCRFVCRAHLGNLLGLIRERGFDAIELPAASSNTDITEPTSHAAWLGTDWVTDLEQTRSVLGHARIDCLVVDHYALDARWERALLPVCRTLMVIDDLANRVHHCHFLLDQNLGREVEDYHGLVPTTCKILAGPCYALLRPRFAALRDYSLQRRVNPQLKRLLISMGGVDQPNATSYVLNALKNSPLAPDCRVTVVMGPHAPWLESVRLLAASMPWPTDVQINVYDMAQLMADSDLSIGAAGSTSWERCCLGLPTLMVVVADNQWLGAKKLQERQAVRLIGGVRDIAMQLPLEIPLLMHTQSLIHMSTTASGITDGQGVEKLLQIIGGLE